MIEVSTRHQYPVDLMWREVRLSARQTVGMGDIDKPVSEKFKREMFRGRHSPVRELRFRFEFGNIPTFAAQHMSRHRIATIAGDFLDENVNPVDIEHYVKTQRPDRTGKKRGSQEDPVFYSCTANAQGIFDMSHKRLCFLAETPVRARWAVAKNQISKVEPFLAEIMVPTCVACGYCPESKKCVQNYNKTKHFERAVERFRSV